MASFILDVKDMKSLFTKFLDNELDSHENLKIFYLIKHKNNKGFRLINIEIGNELVDQISANKSENQFNLFFDYFYRKYIQN